MSEHVETCLNLFRFNMLWIDTILQTCWNLYWISKTLIQIDAIHHTCLNMLLWYELIQFYKHVETCLEFLKPLILIDAIDDKTSLNLLENSDTNWCNLLHLNMSRLVHRYMTKYKNWANQRRNSWRQSYSLDRFDERAVKNWHNTQKYINTVCKVVTK